MTMNDGENDSHKRNCRRKPASKSNIVPRKNPPKQVEVPKKRKKTSKTSSTGTDISEAMDAPEIVHVFNLTEKEPSNMLDAINEDEEEEEVFEDDVFSPSPESLRQSSHLQTPLQHSLPYDSDEEEDLTSTNVNSDLDFGSDDIHDEKAWDTDLEPDDVFDSYDHSGKNAYIEGCRHLGVIPASYFLRHMQDKDLDMRHHGLGTTGIKAISISLVSNAHVVKLNLSDNWLDRDASFAICDMLKENCFITEINLSENRLCYEFVEALTDSLQTNMTLSTIDISGNSISDRGAQLFANIIDNTKTLVSLNLSNNRLGEYAGCVLGPAISENSCIKSLDLSWNSIRRKGAIAVAQGIKNNVFLKKMNLAWNGFGNEGAAALGDALKTNAALEELDVSNNRIMAEGAVWIGKGMSFNENIVTLKMGQNPMETAGCFAICAAILRNPTTVLKYLDFRDIEVNEDCLKMIKNVQTQIPDISLIHGSLGTVYTKQRTRAHPMYKLRHYMQKHDLRIVDFFNKFDKDHSMSVTRKEFIQGIVETGIKLTEDEIESLVEELDKDGDGEVNYSELVAGHAAYVAKEKQIPIVISASQ